MHVRLYEKDLIIRARLMPSILAIIPSVLVAIRYPGFHYTYQLAIASIALSVALWFLTRARDPYGLFHLSLNKLPSDNPEASPRTEWLNMGYWKARACRLRLLHHLKLNIFYGYQETRVFPEACEGRFSAHILFVCL
jgi:hypothetical protein